MWFDYDHVFGPSALINCKKNTRECVGFHHDYQGRIRSSGLVEFHNIEEGPHGTYSAYWTYSNAKLKYSTFFPEEWIFKKVLKKIIEASKNIKSCEFNQNKWITQGMTMEGMLIEIVFEADLLTKHCTRKITSAYPIFEINYDK